MDIPTLKEHTVVPFVFSPEQVDQLLDVIIRRIRKNETYFLTDLAIYLVVLLMARCGMRISEPIKLLRPPLPTGRCHPFYRKDQIR